MTVLKIYTYPNPVLREQCVPVTAFDTALEKLVRDMTETLYSYPGTIGLAAPQVGVPQRVFLVDVSAKTSRDQLRVYINPVITQTSRNKLVREGCLSFPEYLVSVKRAMRVTLTACDASGNTFEQTAEDLEAVALQHETDHLDGIVFIDRINTLKTDILRRGTTEKIDPNHFLDLFR